MDDVLVEMEAIREFVVESLAEFRSELSAMNLKIQSADKKTDELDNSYKDFCEKYSGLEERIENIFSQAETVPQIRASENTFQMTRRRRRTRRRTKPASPPLWTTSVHK